MCIRDSGMGSFGDTSPLYVVDGMFYDNINFLNNSDIQDMTILKDTSASAIYGVRAANGVVILSLIHICIRESISVSPAKACG